jgi:hypothetical protein
MSPRARRGFGAVLVVVVLGGIGSFLALGGNQAQQADPPAEDEKLNRFQFGIDLGRERAAFSGLPMVEIFVDETVDKASLDACLESPEIKALITNFTGVLVSSDDEAAHPRRLRRKERHGAFVRGVNGRYLGILPPGYTCEDRHAMLERSLRNMIMKPRKSPIYAALLASPDVIDRLIEEGKRDRARMYVDFLKEFEGKDHPAAIAAEARLAAR